jgi:hypothetical protein
MFVMSSASKTIGGYLASSSYIEPEDTPVDGGRSVLMAFFQPLLKIHREFIVECCNQGCREP